MIVIAKPSGISLRDHIRHVQEQANEIFAVWPFLAIKYARLTNGQDLQATVERAITWHDEGKRIDPWQAACQKDYAEYQRWLTLKGFAPLGVVAAQYRQYEWEMKSNNKATGIHLRDAKFRHEFGSLKLAEDKKIKLSISEKAAIAAHHSKLGKRHINRWNTDGNGAFKRHWAELVSQEINLSRQEPDRWEKLLLARYEIAAVRTLLQLADTRASRKEAESQLAPLSKFEYTFPHGNNYRGVQKAALDLADLWCSILRAPTGSGKTDASLLWAREQIIDNGKPGWAQKADRLIIAMPTRFTANALSLDVRKNVSATGLYHSSAWFTEFGHLSDADKNNARELQRMAQLLATPVTVCTVDHLLISLTGAAEYHHSSFFFLANSAVVFDEADFYDPFVQANLTVLLKTLRVLRVPVLIMSATVPDSARELYGVSDAIKEPEENEVPPNRSLAWAGRRIQVDDYPDLPVMEQAEDVADILQKMVKIGHGIIYANTVERALMYYNWFAKQPEKPEVILYHSRFTEPDKKIIEKKLIAALGKPVWEQKSPQPTGIAILTQIGEMSINISSSIMLSDLCPWDRLAQRLGRLNRFAKTLEAVAYITVPFRKETIYVAPYGQLKAKEWIKTESFTKTLASAMKKIPAQGTVAIMPDELVKIVNSLYPELLAFPDKATDNRGELYNLMNANWLIVPDRRLNEEAGTVSTVWRSRDIEEHRTVFTRPPENFKNYEQYQEFALQYGVSCPIWMVEREIRKPEEERRIITVKVLIDDEDEPMLYTNQYESWSEENNSGNIEGYIQKFKSKRGMAFLYDKKEIESDNDIDDESK